MHLFDRHLPASGMKAERLSRAIARHQQAVVFVAGAPLRFLDLRFRLREPFCDPRRNILSTSTTAISLAGRSHGAVHEALAPSETRRVIHADDERLSCTVRDSSTCRRYGSQQAFLRRRASGVPVRAWNVRKKPRQRNRRRVR